MKDLMAGIDLHSNNIMVGLVDGQGQRLAHQKLPCELKRILEFLAPFKDRLQTLAVESTEDVHEAGVVDSGADFGTGVFHAA